MPFVRAGDLVVHYDFAGPRDAPVVMLANSLGTNVHVWDEQVNALTRSHRLLRYDMRGHGLTDTTPNDDPAAGSIERLTADVVALLDVLGLHRISFVGLSIGGMVGQRLAARYPERVDALAVCASASRSGTPEIWNARIESVQRDGIDAIVDATMGRWFTERTHADRPELVSGIANMLRRTPVEGYLGGCRAVRDADLRADDALIRTRTLIVEGEHDPLMTPAAGAELRDAIANAELVVLHGASHMLCAEQPIAFNEALLRFLEGG
ncbi:MAG TPA: 3-oxoadipate enol-lactonase [Candidatus Elarobacter sp.]|jgi:3-oxoadipate enol-lactonase|nr:3-oxoadipate enol-lactonase [Candidatus Elarobacter sp.]